MTALQAHTPHPTPKTKQILILMARQGRFPSLEGLQGRRRRHGVLLVSLFIGGTVGVLLSKWLTCLPLPLKLSSRDDSSEDPLPRVALLFLSRGPFPHEALWHSWLDAASSLLPREVLQRCKRTRYMRDPNAVVAPCSAAGFHRLFSIYLHAPPSFSEGYPAGSLWSTALIKERVETGWGEHSLVAATKALIVAAFADQLNQRFILLSESDIPLYGPATFYLQLMAETRSRLNACPPQNKDQYMPHRWTEAMTTPNMNISHWRKSSQWFTLQRRHAQLVVEDTEVFDSFQKHCRYTKEEGYVRDCFSDEHYIPTLFAVKGLQGDEMDCASWGVAAIDWGNGGAHPRAYRPEDITPGLIAHLRRTPEEATKAQRSASKLLLTCATPLTCSDVVAAAAAKYEPLGSVPLTARKFPPETVEAVLSVFSACAEGLELLSGRPCKN